jgi:16S rRNA (guanine527-N7)-methyltransferase
VTTLTPRQRESLERVLSQAQQRGFLGPGPVGPQIDHALGFAQAAGPPDGDALDLGSGGGLPGLVLGVVWPEVRWLLLDAQLRRVTFLSAAVDELGLAERVRTLQARAEEVGRDERHRGKYSLVVSRSFGPPAVVAECGAPLLRVGGHLVVSEPPGSEDGADKKRWPLADLTPLGLEPDPADKATGYRSTAAGFARFVQARPCPDRYPRRVGVPARRPLF